MSKPLAVTPHQAGPGLVPLRHPEGIGCSCGGCAYAPGPDGIIWVPHEAVLALFSHGFAVAALPVAPPQPAPDSVTAAPALLSDRRRATGEACAHCGGPLAAKRSTGRFCSPRCRVAAYRRRGRLK